MRYQQTTPATALLTLQAIKTHCRIDLDNYDEDDYLAALLSAATSHAELVMATSLISRQIVATFYSNEPLYLPRGPVASVQSVGVASGGPAVPLANCWQLETYGTADVLRINGGTLQPYASPSQLVVTYTAGYGTDPAAVPADILQVIRCHIGAMYANRETVSDKPIKAIPWIESFYQLRSREPGIG